MNRMGTHYTQSMPLARLVSWWFARRDRRDALEAPPTIDMECAAAGCGKMVPAGQGAWLPDLRVSACNDDCAHIIRGYWF